MIFTLARKNLTHDKVRLVVTLTGVVFAVVLIAVQIGLFVGFTKTISGVIDHSGVDVWVAVKGLRNFDVTSPLKERKLYQILSVPSVAKVEKLIIGFQQWKKAGGGEESIEIVGFDLESGLGGPWSIVEGDVASLDMPDTVMIDTLYKDKLAIGRLGDTAEINGHRARVVGFTRGIRSFTTSPYVFTSFKNGLNYTGLKEDETMYLLAKARPGVSPERLREDILSRVPDIDAFTTPEFAKRTQDYWLFTTGAGMSLFVAAALGLVVGVVVVAQTLYATTMDHLPEFATLRAMGAPGSYIHKIIVVQALISAVLGYTLGMGASLALVWGSTNSSVAILMPWEIATSLFILTLVMCTTAALVSIHRVTRIDPSMVFAGR